MSGEDHLLLDLDLGTIKPRKKRVWLKKTRIALRIVLFPLKWLLVFALPFLILVRGSVWACQTARKR